MTPEERKRKCSGFLNLYHRIPNIMILWIALLWFSTNFEKVQLSCLLWKYNTNDTAAEKAKI